MRGVKKRGVRLGNWLTAEQGKCLLNAIDHGTICGKRDYAMIAVLLGCCLRRAELAGVTLHDLQSREDHWVFADMVGKGGYIRTVPVPGWVESTIRTWLDVAEITEGPLFRAIKKAGRIATNEFTPKVI